MRKVLSQENKKFLKTVLFLALPIVFQELISSGINLLDTVMIGRLGESEVTAVGLANQIFFLYILLVFGVNSGASIFIAQFWGKGDKISIHKVMGIAIITGVIASLVFVLGGVFIPEVLLTIFSKDPLVINLGSEYLRIVVFSYIFTAITSTFRSALRSTGQTKLPIVSSLVALVMNAGFNALLIFGLMGFPRLGVIGAAYATLIARVFEMLSLIFCTYYFKFGVAGKVKDMFSFSWPFVKIFFATAGFVIFNEMIWSVGTALYNVAYREVGTQAQAAVQISSTVTNLFYVLTVSFGNAGGIVLGNYLGAGKREKAIEYCKKFLVFVPALGALMGLCLYLSSPLIVSFFHVSDIAADYTMKIMAVTSLYLWLRSLNHLIIVGILRSGGDTIYGFFVDCVGVWCVGVPMAFIGAYVWRLPIYVIYALVNLEEIVKALMGLRRTLSMKWAKNIVEKI